MFRVDSSRFNNYPAYEFNLEPLDFYQVNNVDLPGIDRDKKV